MPVQRTRNPARGTNTGRPSTTLVQAPTHAYRTSLATLVGDPVERPARSVVPARAQHDGCSVVDATTSSASSPSLSLDRLVPTIPFIAPAPIAGFCAGCGEATTYRHGDCATKPGAFATVDGHTPCSHCLGAGCAICHGYGWFQLVPEAEIDRPTSTHLVGRAA